MKWKTSIGRRGLSLITYGVLWLVISVPLWTADSYDTLLHIVTFKAWGVAFIVAALLAFIGASKQSPFFDKAGFGALNAVGVLWVLRCVVVFIIDIFTAHSGALGVFLQGLILSLLVFKVYIDAGWSEPTTHLMRRKGDE